MADKDMADADIEVSPKSDGQVSRPATVTRRIRESHVGHTKTGGSQVATSPVGAPKGGHQSKPGLIFGM
jgi:hypothetical protein